MLLLRNVSAGLGQHVYFDTHHPSTSSARFAICTFSSAQLQCKQRPKRIRMCLNDAAAHVAAAAQ